MNKDLRIKKLKEIMENDTPYMTGIRIRYKGEIQEFKAYKIPLEFLIYNKYNGRIGSVVKSFEKQHRSINPEDLEDRKRLEGYLYESKPGRNEATLKNLIENGQQQYGIVTNDGVIIDGNRRASLLNKIYSDRKRWPNHNLDHCRYFIAVILPDTPEPKEIMKLETTYQMGADEKLDYNPIEKYLKCKDLKDVGYDEPDIADMMGEKESTIKEWLEIMELMDSYLEYLEYTGIYTRLEKREGQFVDLNAYLKAYKKGTNKVEWGVKESDISDLQAVCFDYIRAQYEGKEFRSIAKPSKKEGIFCHKEIWESFLNEHSKHVDSITEDSPEKLYKDNSEGDLSKLLEARDEMWTKNARGLLQGNLNISVRKLEDKKDANQPLELLKRAKNALEAINPDALDKYNLDLVKEISSIVWDYKKIIEKK
ncbi:hypothetical protein [Paenibacillus lutimineralis]|uniref:ParB/Sulfiredoxin domain-containing protein n=1 Tax=Paenibacillus lutimineralis TaxID=2707005 RepID=A0A3Q9I874_9BACL|nr:hypothetical protein [Paenibacillus lutimineralis]AZS13307.1 hypothetical protein EI981_01700 [Paenibacillus lutimineralis]